MEDSWNLITFVNEPEIAREASCSSMFALSETFLPVKKQSTCCFTLLIPGRF
jgi:hypothetical protein